MKKQKEQPLQKIHTKKPSSCEANKKSLNESITLPVNGEKICTLESSSISSSVTTSNHEAVESMCVKENPRSSETLIDHEKLLANEDYIIGNSSSYSSTGSNHEKGEIMGISEETNSCDPLVELHDSFWAQPYQVEAFETSLYYPEKGFEVIKV